VRAAAIFSNSSKRDAIETRQMTIYWVISLERTDHAGFYYNPRSDMKGGKGSNKGVQTCNAVAPGNKGSVPLNRTGPVNLYKPILWKSQRGGKDQKTKRKMSSGTITT